MSLGQILKDSYGLKEEDLSKALNLQKDLAGISAISLFKLVQLQIVSLLRPFPDT